MSDNKLILYNLDLSPPVRTVKIVARLLKLELELRDVNLLEAEHLKEEYVKVNPEHTVPTLVDNDLVIWDSHTIVTYLIDKYAKDDHLYPKDLQLRARVNQRLFFDAASLFVRLRDCSIYVIWQGGTEIPKDKVDPIYDAFEVLERFLQTDTYLVGNELTVADISVAVTVLPLEMYAPLKADKHAKILAWINRIRKEIPFFDEMNAEHVQTYRNVIQSKLDENRRK